ncbi:MAG: metallophosphoesterase [Halioglobus sp.]|nr:metallophosphoesterase [Halioglobus sp.]MBP6725104.1 metallophosphoesterase [Halioglobus sp.]
MTSIAIGVVGDLHTHWDDVDVAQFDGSNYDLLFFTGDLGGGTRDSSLRMARVMSRLSKPALVMPGNNDTGDIAELAAELSYRSGINWLAAARRALPTNAGGGADASINLCGYSAHRLTRGAVDVTLIAARPHSMGGSQLSFPDQMMSGYGIDSIDASTARLFELVDQLETEQVVFLAHNGPSGLGDAADAMWGCDFRPGGGDWGDEDLSAAIEYAVSQGRRVLAVVAGHMHLRTKAGHERPWRVERAGILYINAARVPRIFAAKGDVHRHHVALRITAAGVEAEEVLVPESGQR